VFSSADAGLVAGQNTASVFTESGTAVASQLASRSTNGSSYLTPAFDDFRTESFANFGGRSFVHSASFLGSGFVGNAAASASVTFESDVQLIVSWDWSALSQTARGSEPNQLAWLISAGSQSVGLAQTATGFVSTGGAMAAGQGSMLLSFAAGTTVTLSSELWGNSNSGNVVMNWVAVPTPGALALLGVAGLAARRRTR
jgi:hypothetical protein